MKKRPTVSKKSKPCPYCKKPISWRYARHIIAGIPAGPNGRPKGINDADAVALRKKGMSFRKIASKLKCSTSAVQRAVNQWSDR